MACPVSAANDSAERSSRSASSRPSAGSFTAWGLFSDAECQSRAATFESTKQLHRLHQAATDHAAKFEPRLSTLAITVLPENRAGGLEILRNNERLDPGAWNKALPFDGGTYKITARAPGNADWASAVTVRVYALKRGGYYQIAASGFWWVPDETIPTLLGGSKR